MEEAIKEFASRYRSTKDQDQALRMASDLRAKIRTILKAEGKPEEEIEEELEGIMWDILFGKTNSTRYDLGHGFVFPHVVMQTPPIGEKSETTSNPIHPFAHVNDREIYDDCVECEICHFEYEEKENKKTEQ